MSWAFTSVAILLTAGRLWIRARIIRRVGWDDAAHLLGCLLLVALVALVSAASSMMYHLGSNDTNGPSNEITIFYRLDLAATLISWCCLWLIKSSFLILYRHIFSISSRFLRAWWIVSAVVFLTFWVVIAGCVTQCGNPTQIDRIGIFH